MARVRVGRVGLFLLLTFALSWGFDAVVIAACSGRETCPTLAMTPWGMFTPAFVALILQLFFFRDSPIYFRQYKERPRWILFGFLLLTPAYGIVTLLAAVAPSSGRLYQGVGALLITLWTLLVFFVSGQSEAQALERAGLQLGNVKQAQRFVLGIVAFFAVQAILNLGLDLGELQGRATHIYGLPIPAAVYPVALAVLFLAVTAIGTPLSGLGAVFGEEYGWRGFLQGELVKLGRLPGVLLVGLVWGIWHFPIILRGMHTYPPTAVGLLLGVVFFVLWGFVQSYAVLKTGSIWVAAFMHGLVNSMYGFVLTYVVRPADNVLSFGLGVFGLACIALVVMATLRDPVWKAGPAAAE